MSLRCCCNLSRCSSYVSVVDEVPPHVVLVPSPPLSQRVSLWRMFSCLRLVYEHFVRVGRCVVGCCRLFERYE